MKIIAKEHDFIDSIQAHGMDKNVVYVRKTESRSFVDQFYDDPIYKKLNNRFQKLENFLKTHSQYHRCVIFGFCGKIYPMYNIPYSERKFEPLIGRYVRQCAVKHQFVTSSEEIIDIYKNHRYEDESVAFLDRKKKRGFTQKIIDPILSDLYGDDSFGWLFTELNVPVFVLTFDKYRLKDVTLTTNPLLIDYDFGKIMDAYTAYQEIGMYISGVLGVGSTNVVDISDIHMRDAKGFNDSSFKTRKGTKKPRKKK